METLINDIALINKQARHIVDLRRELILKGKISLNEKHLVGLDSVAQTLTGICFYLMGLKRNSKKRKAITANQT
jgi:hypothetical protein